jgi:phosphoenolpyruvate---glycerone phosphotransferase subunit DhaM
MIGILIISHSAQVARGVKELAEQMAKGTVRIAAAGGTIEGDLGTSTDVIARALDELRGVEAVLALVDMGSAVMSAEMALELAGLPFQLSGAPLVEGAVVAAVEATREGATLAEVAAAAERALEAKQTGAQPAPPPAAEPPAAPQAGPAPAAGAEATVTITNRVGLHMRPAKEFVQTAASFAGATIRVRNLDRPERPEGNAKSMIDVMKLGVAFGQRIQLRAEGEGAQEAVAALAQLVENNFGEE